MYAFGVGQFGLVSIVTLSTIAVERYMVITAKPMSGTWKLTRQGATKVSEQFNDDRIDYMHSEPPRIIVTHLVRLCVCVFVTHTRRIHYFRLIIRCIVKLRIET